MELEEAMEKRRAYRSLEDVETDSELIRDLAEHAQLSASCFNNQPWRFVFVRSEDKLDEMYSVMSSTNEWTTDSSMIIAVFSEKDSDCVVKEREYYLFDTGMATAFLILRATELGLVAHPIAGYDEQKAKEILDIPEELRLITLVIVGEHSDGINDTLTDKQAEIEKERPERSPLRDFVYLESYNNPLED